MVPAEQRAYARWLELGTRAGLWLLIAAFVAYVLGVIEPHVALERLPTLWGLPADRYQALTRSPTGWGWLALLHRSDYLSLLAVAMLALITLVCYLRILLIHAGRGERVVATIIAAQVIVLLAAASGVLAGGH